MSINLSLDYHLRIVLFDFHKFLEVHGYKIISITINTLSEFSVEGYINDDCIKSKNSYVEYVD
ncbi:hypothetical protein ACVZHU_18335, partial [Clostridioides difficile]